MSKKNWMIAAAIALVIVLLICNMVNQLQKLLYLESLPEQGRAYTTAIFPTPSNTVYVTAVRRLEGSWIVGYTNHVGVQAMTNANVFIKAYMPLK